MAVGHARGRGGPSLPGRDLGHQPGVQRRRAGLATPGGEPERPDHVKVWDVATGLEVLALPGFHGLIQGLAFSSDGRWLASATDGAIRIWDVTPLGGAKDLVPRAP